MSVENEGIKKVVLICSKETGSRSGKDTLCNAMIKHFIYTVQRSKTYHAELSAPLKYIGENFLGLDDEHLRGDKKEELTDIMIDGEYVSGRRIQQLEADHYRGRYGEDFFVKIVDRKIKTFYEETDFLGGGYHAFVFVSDFRFDNEYRYLKEKGHDIITINVIRPSNKSGITSHNSDHGLTLESFDYTIINDGSIDDLEEKAIDIMNDIMEKNKISVFGCC